MVEFFESLIQKRKEKWNLYLEFSERRKRKVISFLAPEAQENQPGSKAITPRALVAKPKFYYFDAGVYRSIRPKGPLDAPEELNGITLETLVAQHLRAWLDYSTKEGWLYFWRTKGGLEVDFIVYGEIGFYAIEVKHSKHIQPKDLRGLSEFNQDYPEANSGLPH